MRIVLASASPRRRELLAQIGFAFEIQISEGEEKITSRIPCQVVEELSYQKAKNVAERLLQENREEPILVIGADTIVAFQGEILGKPATPENAVEMLTKLQGNTHQVYTGVTCLYLVPEQGGKPMEGVIKKTTFHERTEVAFYPMTPQEIRTYVSTKDPMDKAGAYGIQGFCARYIKEIQGDYNNVVGLPVGRLYQEIKELLTEEGLAL